jgi:hypothetical protein
VALWLDREPAADAITPPASRGPEDRGRASEASYSIVRGTPQARPPRDVFVAGRRSSASTSIQIGLPTEAPVLAGPGRNATQLV